MIPPAYQEATHEHLWFSLISGPETTPNALFTNIFWVTTVPSCFRKVQSLFETCNFIFSICLKKYMSSVGTKELGCEFHRQSREARKYSENNKFLFFLNFGNPLLHFFGVTLYLKGCSLDWHGTDITMNMKESLWLFMTVVMCQFSQLTITLPHSWRLSCSYHGYDIMSFQSYVHPFK